jgi:hypothetical protein
VSREQRVKPRARESKKGDSIGHIRKAEQFKPIKSPGERILFLQRTIGNRAVQRLISSEALLAKNASYLATEVTPEMESRISAIRGKGQCFSFQL